MRGPLKYHGGKSYLAKKIVDMMPPHKHFVEPYFGGGAVLLNHPHEGVSEVANDIFNDLTLFWAALRSEEAFPRLRRKAQASPFSEDLWRQARIFLSIDAPDAEDQYWERNPSCLADRGYWFLIHCRMSLAGRLTSFASISRSRIRGGMNEQANAWLSTVENLDAVHERLRRVVILSRPALEVIAQQDGPETCFYLDPPYLQSTREAGGYRHEMTQADHMDLLVRLGGVHAARQMLVPEADWPRWWLDAMPLKGAFLLSGYPSDLYEAVARACAWRRVEFSIPNQASSSRTKSLETEVVWMNYQPPVESNDG